MKALGGRGTCFLLEEYSDLTGFLAMGGVSAGGIHLAWSVGGDAGTEGEGSGTTGCLTGDEEHDDVADDHSFAVT